MSTKKLFIPEKIKVGFQKREGTYTGKLAYVIYYDQLGKLRKEKSWQSWRSSNIKPLDCENEPTEGFVLNKGVGGYRCHWNHRNEYIRVYDPRDFEFEISVANLLFILKECDCSRGKGLEGKFVYAWDGTELALLPVSCEDYKECSEFTALQAVKISAKDLIKGGSYMTKQQETYIYLGRFERYRVFENDGYQSPSNPKSCKKKTHVFLKGNEYVFLDSMAKLGAVISDTPVPDYAEKVDKYYKSVHGSRVTRLFLKDVTKKDEKDYRLYYAYETDDAFVHWSESHFKSIYHTTHHKITLQDNVLTFENYHYESYPKGYNGGSFGGHRTSTLPWVEARQKKILWAELESGSKYKVGYYGLVGGKNDG